MSAAVIEEPKEIALTEGDVVVEKGIKSYLTEKLPSTDSGMNIGVGGVEVAEGKIGLCQARLASIHKEEKRLLKQLARVQERKKSFQKKIGELRQVLAEAAEAEKPKKVKSPAEKAKTVLFSALVISLPVLVVSPLLHFKGSAELAKTEEFVSNCSQSKWPDHCINRKARLDKEGVAYNIVPVPAVKHH